MEIISIRFKTKKQLCKVFIYYFNVHHKLYSILHIINKNE